MTKRAIIHVENTEGVLDFARYLTENGWTILSANKTEELFHKEKIPVIREQALVENNLYINDTSNLIQAIIQTKYPDSNNYFHHEENKDSDIYILCLNLYPSMYYSINFNNPQQIKAITKPFNFYISTLLRNAFLNYENLLILTDPADYKEATIQLRTNNITNEFRVYLAAKALNLISAFDSGLAGSLLMESHFKNNFMNYLTFPFKKFQALNAGANPLQNACLYKFPYDVGAMTGFQKLHIKELNYNIINDASLAWEQISMMYTNLKNQYTVKTTNNEGYTFTTQFTPQTGTVFTIAIKYKNILGASFSTDVLSSFKNTYSYDNSNITGVTIGSSSVIDETAAKEIVQTKIAAIVAPGFTAEAKEILAENKSIVLIPVTKLHCSDYNVELINGGMLFQTKDSVIFEKWNVKTKKRPAQYMADQMIFGMMIAMAAKTYSAILIKNNAIIGIAQSCKSSINAVDTVLLEAEDYIKREAKKGNHIANENNNFADLLVCDTEVPLCDSIKKLIEKGITAIIQTGGSTNDDEFIQYCNDHEITLIFTGQSHISC